MTDEAFTYEEYENIRRKFVGIINDNLNDKDKEFLLSVKNATPDWSIYDFQRFPSINWKLKNIQKLKDKNPDKHKEQYEALRKKLHE